MLLLIALGVAGWFYADTLYLLAANRGRLLVEGVDPGTRLIVHRGGETLVLELNRERRDLVGRIGNPSYPPPDVGRIANPSYLGIFTLPAGDYEAELEGDPEGLELSAERFTVRRNEEHSSRSARSLPRKSDACRRATRGRSGAWPYHPMAAMPCPAAASPAATGCCFCGTWTRGRKSASWANQPRRR